MPRMILNRVISQGIRWITNHISQYWNRRKAKQEPDIEVYKRDLKAAGATDINCNDDGTVIHVEFNGRWVDLEQRVRLDYRMIAEQPSADSPTAIALRPGPG